MTIKFVKNNLDREWYLKDKTWRGDQSDLKLPSGIAQLVEEECSIGAEEVSFKVDTFFIENSKNIQKLSEHDGKATYDTLYGTLEMCDIALLFFPHGYPEMIYYKIVANG